MPGHVPPEELSTRIAGQLNCKAEVEKRSQDGGPVTQEQRKGESYRREGKRTEVYLQAQR